MKKIIFLLFVAISTGINAQVADSMQTKGSTDTITKIYDFTEVMPEFPGGKEAMVEFLRDNIQYPETALKNKIEGTVYVKFIVDKNGVISKPVIMRGIGGGCDEEVIRVLSLMPKWSPPKQSDKPCSVYYTMPIKFSIKDSKGNKRKNNN